MKTNTHLKQNIARLSAIVTSGNFSEFQYLDDPNDDTKTVVTTKLTSHQMQGHINALLDNLKALSATL